MAARLVPLNNPINTRQDENADALSLGPRLSLFSEVGYSKPLSHRSHAVIFTVANRSPCI